MWGIAQNINAHFLDYSQGSSVVGAARIELATPPV
jgi:hypothetical protein